MSKTIWDRFAPIYSLAMKSHKNIYDYMYKHIADAVMGKKVLELGKVPSNVVFEIADASNLHYEDKFFDVVIIANALHVVPNPEKVLAEIDRVLVDDGLLICPTFIHRSVEKKENLWAKLLKAVGINFAHQWTAEEFKTFIESKGWKITASEVVPGRIDLMYAECVRK